MNFSTENLARVFAEDGKYEGFRRLASDLVRGNQLYDYDDAGNKVSVSKREANGAVRRVFMEVCGLTEDDLRSNKRRKRAEEQHKYEIYEIIEEDIEFKVQEGFQDSEWFNRLVDQRNVALGDANEFVSNENQYFVVTEVSGDNHDITMQQLMPGQSYMVKTTAHAVKIGKDIDLVILGRVAYSDWIQKISDAFVQDTQKRVFDAVYGAEEKLPTGDTFKKTGTLSSTTKDSFDELLENVSAANNAEVLICGTKTALKKLNSLADINWISDGQKDAVATMGRLSDYEGTELVEAPQRFKVGTFEKMLPNNKLLVFARTDDKFVKFVDEGETEISEITEKADLQDDFETYEVQRRYGVGTVLGQYFGVWTIE